MTWSENKLRQLGRAGAGEGGAWGEGRGSGRAGGRGGGGGAGGGGKVGRSGRKGGSGGGRVGGKPGDLFGTAVACFVLAIPNRYLPILQEGEIESLQGRYGDDEAGGS